MRASVHYHLRHFNGPTGPTASACGQTSRAAVEATRECPVVAAKIPGFRAHRGGCAGRQVREVVPGFGARRYRDFEHAGRKAQSVAGTGIGDISHPGFGAYDHRESGHTRTGIGGILGRIATGLPGTNDPANGLKAFGIGGRNCVPNNSKRNTTTGGARIFGGGGR